jgi:hypothetical protein
MSDFLELIESVRADQADATRVFSGEGTALRAAGGKRDPRYPQKLRAFAEAFADAVHGGDRKSVYLLKEAMSTSDFPLLFGDVIDRSMLGKYREWAPVWPAYAVRRSVRDFRNVSEYDIVGGEAPLDLVPQGDEYPERKVDEARLQWSIRKYGAAMPFLWEAFINDDFQALADVPARFARAARRTEDKFATELHVDTNGPHAGVYTAGNLNIINVANGAATNNPALSIVGLQDGFNVLARATDTDGQPILIELVTLEVPPALEITALNIINAVQINVVEAGGVANQQLWAQNWMRNRLKLVVNPYLPIVAATANGNRSWFLHPTPSGDGGRPAFRMGFLQGHEEPEMFMKAPGAVRVGGGEISPFDGSFENDSIEYKVRYVLGGRSIDPKMTVASNGSGA